MRLNAQRNLKLLNILTFFFGFRAYEGVLALFFASITESYTLAMTMFAIINFTASLFEVPTGILSDHIGRKKTIILYLLTGTVAVVFYYLATSTETLMIAAVFTGISMAFGSGTMSAFTYENVEVLGKLDEYKKLEGRRKAIGRYSLVVAGILGTGIIYLYDIKAAILLTLVVLVLACITSFFLSDLRKFELDKSNIFADLGKAWRYFFTDPILRDISIGKMMALGIGNSEYRFRSLFFSAIMPEWLVNLLGMLNNLICGFAMQLAHWIVHRFGIMRALVHIDILDRSIITACVMLYTFTSGVLMNIITSISYGIREVAAEDLLQARYTKDQRATMGSLVSLGGTLIYGVVAIAAGLLADKIGLLYTMLAFQPLLLIGTFFFWKGLKRIK